MLVLSRKPGESIVIDGGVVVTVLDIGRGRVQVGITARAKCRWFGRNCSGVHKRRALRRRGNCRSATECVRRCCPKAISANA